MVADTIKGAQNQFVLRIETAVLRIETAKEIFLQQIMQLMQVDRLTAEKLATKVLVEHLKGKKR